MRSLERMLSHCLVHGGVSLQLHLNPWTPGHARALACGLQRHCELAMAGFAMLVHRLVHAAATCKVAAKCADLTRLLLLLFNCCTPGSATMARPVCRAGTGHELAAPLDHLLSHFPEG